MIRIENLGIILPGEAEDIFFPCKKKEENMERMFYMLS
jgi:hypothetical protein